MKHLLSFLTLLVLGWGQAWGITSVTYPHTWDFTKWDSNINWGWPWELTTDATGTFYNAKNFTRSNYDGELTDKASNGNDYQILQETAGLKIFAGNERCRIYMDGQGIGLSLRSGATPTITVPGLKYGQSVRITMGSLLSASGFHPNDAKVKFPDDTENTRAMDNTYIYDIPSDVTTATDQVFTFNATSGEYVTIKKIEVVPNLETSFRYGVCDAFNNGSTENNRTGLNWKANGGASTIEYSDTQIGVAFSLRGLINNGVTLADLCGVSSADEVTNDLIAQYFTVTSSDNNVLDASSSAITKHGTANYFNVTNVKPMNCGTATLTIVYKGNDIYKPLTYRNTITINGQAGPRIVWVTAFNSWSEVPTEDFEGRAGNFVNQILGGTYRRYYLNLCGPFGNGETRCVDTGVDNIFTKYNDNANFQAYALAPDAVIPSWWHKMSIGSENAECYYFVREDNTIYDGPEDEFTLKFSDSDIRTYNTRLKEREGNTLGWREYKTDWRPFAVPDQSFFYNSDYTMSAINYSTNATSPQVYTNVQTLGTGNTVGAGSKFINITFNEAMNDSLEIYAEVPVAAGVNPAKSTVKILVADGVLNFQFQPKEVNVMEDAWIMPYVLLPDVPLRDFKRIYVTLDDGTIASVDDADKLYENLNGADIDNMTNAELDALCGDYIEWKRVEAKTHKEWSDEANDSVVVVDVPSYIAITAIRPKIWGITPDQSTYVHIHVESDAWADTGASIKVNVVGRMADLFHWEINNNEEGHDDKEIKTIYISEDDFIYMPGIVGTPNGNTDYSAKESYKYAYTIKKGVFTMNRAEYFYREGVPNYFFTKSYTTSTESFSGYAPSGTRMIPTNEVTKTTDANTEAVIFWATGLGNYYRNDSLMIYANNQTTGDLYLWAEDAQTGVCCTPIKVVIYQKSDLKSDRTQIMSEHTYPFTWDFEHLDICGLDSIVNDANNNGGTYWRMGRPWNGKVWNAKVKWNEYYQYNGAFNADWDDKDNNYDQTGYDDEGNIVSGSRQRWFKDIKANGKYMDLFKGLRLNVAGLDYWQQKYQRLYVSSKPEGGIYFVGGVTYLSLPGFGINGQNIIQDATREAGTVNMPHSDIHFNTNDHNSTQAYFESGFGKNGNAYYHDNILERAEKRNNKVYFVIKASGNNSNESVIFVGGKRMMEQTNTNSTKVDEKGTGTTIGENGTRFSRNENQPYTQRISLTETPKVYVLPMNPWDEDFQDQIYLAMDHGVHIYWMAISTEPRDLRADYGCYAYSYPVDLDMEKSNLLMDILTVDSLKLSSNINMVPYYGSDYDHSQKALVVDKLLPEVLTETDYKIPAHEGLMFYPSTKLSKDDIAKLPSKTVENKTVVKAKVDAEGNPIFNATHTAYEFETVTGNYTYNYLPTYFIANAQNMKKADYSANRGGRGHVVPMNEELEEDEYVANKNLTLVTLDGETITKNDVPTYAATNRLESSAYSTYIWKDYYGKTGAMPTGDTNVAGYDMTYHWIPMGLTNEYIRRYLTWDDDEDYKVLMEYLQGIGSDGQEKQLAPNDNGSDDINKGDEFDDVETKQYYYDLIGPGVVRYYRANNNNWMKGRRSYLKLTWPEYQINTYGKVINGAMALDGTSTSDDWNQSDPNNAQPNDPGMIDTESISNPANIVGVRVLFAKNKIDEDSVVSDNGGFVDGIEEIIPVSESNDDDIYYNLNGVRVETPSKGVYIHNGKKVIIK